jgi:hypothetical protein
MEAFCAPNQARPTAIASVMASTDDKMLAIQPAEAAVRKSIKNAGGAIAYYNDQLLWLPRTSKALGETDGYARVRTVAVPDVSKSSGSRVIYLLVRRGGLNRWIELNAFDVQNVCVEGKPQI